MCLCVLFGAWLYCGCCLWEELGWIGGAFLCLGSFWAVWLSVCLSEEVFELRCLVGRRGNGDREV